MIGRRAIECSTEAGSSTDHVRSLTSVHAKVHVPRSLPSQYIQYISRNKTCRCILNRFVLSKRCSWANRCPPSLFPPLSPSSSCSTSCSFHFLLLLTFQHPPTPAPSVSNVLSPLPPSCYSQREAIKSSCTVHARWKEQMHRQPAPLLPPAALALATTLPSYFLPTLANSTQNSPPLLPSWFPPSLRFQMQEEGMKGGRGGQARDSG